MGFANARCGKKRLPMGKRVQPAPAGGCAQAIKRFHPDDALA
jgi:hypothetical protein